ncbi:MAG: septum formation inhibitor Maf [Desulfuromonadales bacterium]|nr:MAG: septum formation inhibitor Maf [Desulfuromonadales bacterium]
MRENSRIVLASASPRRLELLASAGVEFDVFASDIPEESIPGESPADFALRLARDKAVATAARTEGRWFIGADTIVVCGGEIMGKPADEADAVRMLKKLSGVAHEVITAYAIYDRERDGLICKPVVTKVFFKSLRDDEIAAYVATGCPLDKAGAYAIQGGAAHMVERIDGSYTNVVGLPLCEVVEDLRVLGAL